MYRGFDANSMQTCTLDINISDNIHLYFNSFITNGSLPMIYLAFCMAALVQSTLGPRVQKPCLSGGLTCIRATSKSIIFRWKSSGISLKKMGVKSARPSFTAFLQLAPMNKELLLKIPTTVTNLQFEKEFKKHDYEFIQHKNANRKITCWFFVTICCLGAQPSATMYSHGQDLARGRF